MSAVAPAVTPVSEAGRLDDRIVRLLGAQARHVAFNGLRRALNAHPESLSRALRRLERGGTVLHDGRGYSLTESSPAPAATRPPDWRTIAQVELPSGLPKEALLGQLAGRWLGRLRWVGVYDHPGDPLLIWSVEGTDGHVVVSVRGRTLRVGVEELGTDPTGALVAAAREILAYGLARVSRLDRPDPGGMLAFAFGPVAPSVREN